MKSKIAVFWLIVFFGLVSVVAAGEHELLKLLPEDDDISGWSRDGETSVATDEASLAGLINGAAPFYIEHGAVEVLFQDYADDKDFLMLEIYRMDSETHAEELYADVAAEESEVVGDLGAEGRVVSNLVGVYLVEYWQNTCFVRLTISGKSSLSQEIVLAFASRIFENMNAR
jgi:hypothetical protein